MNDRPFKILVKYASRGRRQRFFDGLDNIFEFAEFPDRLLVMVTLDLDDLEMNNYEVKEKLSTYKNIHVIYGVSKNKIHACNRDLDKIPDNWKDYHIIANFSDDMKWTIPKWDTYIRVDFNSVSPDFSHYMAYLDPDTHGALSTLYIAGRNFFDRFNHIYNPVYVSLFADNEVEDIAKMIGKYHYTGYSIYHHKNPAYYPDEIKDSMFLTQQQVGWDIDMKTYYERKTRNFDIDLLSLG